METCTFEEFKQKLENEKGQKYWEIISKAQAKNLGLNREKGYEIHHVQPKSLGGDNSTFNRVKLTVFEHCKAHALLAQAIPCFKTLEPLIYMSSRQVTKLGDLERVTLDQLYNWSELREKALSCPKPPEYREKARQTKMERYGNGMGSAYLYSQQRQLEKYGKINGGCVTEEAKEKRRKTNMERYGVPSCIYLESSKQKSLATRIERYGSPMGKAGREEYFDKRNETKLRKYGVKDCRCLPEVQERAAATRLAKYGDTAGLLHTKESQEKSKKSRTVTYAKKKTIVRSDEFKVWFEPVRDKYRRNKDAVKDFLRETGRTYDDYKLYTED